MSCDNHCSNQQQTPGYTISLHRPELLNISLPLGYAAGQAQPEKPFAFGCDQEWYQDHWQRKAGCGPCTSATLLFYLARTNPACRELYAVDQADGDSFCRFMNQIWQYVTPGHMGVNEAGILTRGVTRFAQSRHVSLQSHVFAVPGPLSQRQPFAAFADFIYAGLSLDCPVAFLNLSNGRLENLDSWHWVTITALLQVNPEHLAGIISDSGEKKQIDLSLWYSTTRLGGAAVYFTPEPVEA